MQCPKCSSAMETLTSPQGSAQRCTVCQGLWIDVVDHEALKAQAASIDTGDAEAGRQADGKDRMGCPSCPNSPLLRMVDPQQPHIRFESCPVCYGRYYDAGEFTDLATHSLGDFFKRLGAHERL